MKCGFNEKNECTQDCIHYETCTRREKLINENKEYKKDCFAYIKQDKCKVLKTMACNGCNFYKNRNEVCNSCIDKGTLCCKKCHK